MVQGRWLIRIARYTSVIFSLVVVGLLPVFKPKIGWVLIVSAPWLTLVARALYHRSLLRALHRGLGSVMAVVASVVTLIAALLFASAMMAHWPAAIAALMLGGMATLLSACLFEIASLDARYDDDP